jgi:hypothetical protein
MDAKGMVDCLIMRLHSNRDDSDSDFDDECYDYYDYYDEDKDEDVKSNVEFGLAFSSSA